MQGLSECRVFAAPGVAASWRRFTGSNGTLVRRARLLFYGLAAVAMRVPGLGRSDGDTDPQGRLTGLGVADDRATAALLVDSPRDVEGMTGCSTNPRLAPGAWCQRGRLANQAIPVDRFDARDRRRARYYLIANTHPCVRAASGIAQ